MNKITLTICILLLLIVVYNVFSPKGKNGESINFVSEKHPVKFTATVYFDKVVLDWESPPIEEGSVLRYHIYKNESRIPISVSSSIFTFIDNEVTIGNSYNYYMTVIYINNGVSPRSAVQYVTIPDPAFNPPQNLSLGMKDMQMEISWDPPIPGSDGTLVKYEIYRNNMYLSFAQPNITQVIDSNIVRGNTYSYYLIAVYSNPEGRSSVSNTVSYTSVAIPNTVQYILPNNMELNVLTTTNLVWESSKNGGDPTHYRVYFGSVYPPPIVQTKLVSTLYTPSQELEKDTTYYWKIVSINSAGESINNPIWSFKTIKETIYE